MAFLVIAFVAGLLTVLAPCILPLLPVVIGSSAAGRSSWTPYVVVGSLALSVIAFTFILKVSTAFVMVPPEVWTYISGGILFVFGLTLVFPSLWESIPGLALASVSSNKLLGKGFMQKSLWGDALVGASLGPIFSTCSPTYFVILASVLPVSFLLGTMYILAYVAGLSLMLLLVALIGERLTQGLSGFADPRSWFKRGLGVVFVILGLLIATGTEKQIETSLLNSGVFDVTKVEQQLLEKVPTPTPTAFESGNRYHEIADSAGFVNAEPFKLADYVGKKVILIDFVTYSCINCQRTFPYLKEWYTEYKDQGLIIIGIHTPEFAFEKNIDNVRMAAKKFGLDFPLVLDNNYGTWNAWGNRYWPRKYLIDIHGNVVYDHIGEGGYDETESEIVAALNERKQFLNESGTVTVGNVVPKDAPTIDFSQIKSPETYLGAKRIQYLVNLPKTSCLSGSCTYSFTTDKPMGYELQGAWTLNDEAAVLDKGEGAIRIAFEANKVNLVAGADVGKPVRAQVSVDGKITNVVIINAHDLYNLVDLGNTYGKHILEVKFLDPGVSAFAFTFG